MILLRLLIIIKIANIFWAQTTLISDISLDEWTSTNNNQTLTKHTCGSQTFLNLQGNITKTYSLSKTYPNTTYLLFSLTIFSLDLEDFGPNMLQIYFSNSLLHSFSFANLANSPFNKTCFDQAKTDYQADLKFYASFDNISSTVNLSFIPSKVIGSTKFGIGSIIVQEIDLENIPEPSFIDFNGSYSGWSLKNGSMISTIGCKTDLLKVSFGETVVKQYEYQTSFLYRTVAISFDIAMIKNGQFRDLVVMVDGNPVKEIKGISFNKQTQDSCIQNSWETSTVYHFLPQEVGFNRVELGFIMSGSDSDSSYFLISNIQLKGVTTIRERLDVLPIVDFNSASIQNLTNEKNKDFQQMTLIGAQYWAVGVPNIAIAKTYHFKNELGAVLISFFIRINPTKIKEKNFERIRLEINDRHLFYISTSNVLQIFEDNYSGKMNMLVPVHKGSNLITIKLELIGALAINFQIKDLVINDVPKNYTLSSGDEKLFDCYGNFIPNKDQNLVTQTAYIKTTDTRSIILGSVFGGLGFILILTCKKKLNKKDQKQERNENFKRDVERYDSQQDRWIKYHRKTKRSLNTYNSAHSRENTAHVADPIKVLQNRGSIITTDTGQTDRNSDNFPYILPAKQCGLDNKLKRCSIINVENQVPEHIDENQIQIIVQDYIKRAIEFEKEFIKHLNIEEKSEELNECEIAPVKSYSQGAYTD